MVVQLCEKEQEDSDGNNSITNTVESFGPIIHQKQQDGM